MDDNEIIGQVQAGNAEAFSVLVEKYQHQLLGFIYRLVRDERVVEDIGQEIFVSLYKSIRNFDMDRGTPFSAWLFITARNRCISELRKLRKKSFIPVDDVDEIAHRDQSPEEKTASDQYVELVGESLVQLPEPFRETLLQSLRGNSLEEIAIRSGVSVGTIKSRLSRARQRLRMMLGQTGGKGL